MQLAAAIYYLINFEMSILKKKDKQFSGLLDDPSEFDELMNDLKLGFKENYLDFETSYVPKGLELEKTPIELDYDWKKHDE